MARNELISEPKKCITIIGIAATISKKLTQITKAHAYLSSEKTKVGNSLIKLLLHVDDTCRIRAVSIGEATSES